ncbi:filamentous hemagglutinin N-terminal domain-containing protein, partial [Ramlibacter sp. AN1015]|uniref:two-partner secretion domain-containing protein n=1 Tax=Ramlibacter sp. AN1015 TaxID=3133428 RepID=UPI0030C5BCC2
MLLHPHSRRAAPAHPWRRRLAALLAAVFTAQTLLAGAPAYAQVAAAAGAPAGQRPLLDAATNGVPLVLIAPPSGAGVSRNRYEQFNVGREGLIFNNSAHPTNTHLGGRVQGNPQLGHTPARVILNEVSGAHPSALRGPMEIAGTRADLVVANPNGIVCDGCGFINTSRATLSTGQPAFGPRGELTGLSVRQGLLSIGPGGLNAADQQRLDLLARGMLVEGDIHARELRAIVGANQVAYDSLAATALEATDAAPRFAVDVRHLGGMYADQIYLIATDKGLGVNSTGRLASLSGALVLSADGDLAVKDTTAAGDMALTSAGQVHLAGRTQSDGRLAVAAARGLVTTASVQAQTLVIDAPRLDNSGSLSQLDARVPLGLRLPEGLRNSGTIHAAGELALDAPHISGTAAARGALLSGGALSLHGQRIDHQQLAADGALALSSASALHIADSTLIAERGMQLESRSLTLERSTLATADALSLHATGALTLMDAQLTAAGNVHAAAQGITAHGAVVEAARIHVDAGAGVFDNQQQSQWLASDVGLDALSVAATGIHNSTGELRTNGGLRIDARGAWLRNTGEGLIAGASGTFERLAGLHNQGGRLYSDGALHLVAADIDNRDGAIVTGAGLSIDAARLSLQGGLLSAVGDLTLRADAVQAAGASAVSDRHLRIEAGSLIGGEWQAAGDISAQVRGTLDLGQGKLLAGGDLGIAAEGIRTDGAQLEGQHIALDAGTAAWSHRAGHLVGRASVQASAASTDNAGGLIASAGHMQLTTSGVLINEEGGHIQADGALHLRVGELRNRAGTLLAGGDLTVRSPPPHTAAVDDEAGVGRGGLLNEGGLIAGRQVRIDADVHNAEGVISADHALLIAGAIDNRAGVLEAGDGGIHIDTLGQRLVNTDSGAKRGIVSTGDIRIDAGALDNRGGYIGADGALAVERSSSIANQGGTLVGGDHSVVASAGRIDNRGGAILSQADLLVQAAAVDNSGPRSVVSAARDLTIDAAALDNSGPRSVVFAARDLTIDAAALDNAGTRGDPASASASAGLLAGRHASVTAGALDNTQGAIVAMGEATLRVTGALDNAGGHIAADTADVHTGAMRNDQGRLDAQHSLAVKAGQLSGNGQLTSQRALSLELQGDYTHQGLIAAGTDLRMHTEGRLDNHGVISAQRKLQLSAGALHNGHEGVITGQETALDIAGELTNLGLVNASAGPATVRAKSVRNLGRIYGDEIAISAQRLHNDAAGVIASRTGGIVLELPEGLENTGEALVHSAQDLKIAGPARNDAATLSAQRNLSITGALDNLNTGLRTGTHTRHEALSRLIITPNTLPGSFEPGELGWNDIKSEGGRWVVPSTTYPFETFGDEFVDAAISCVPDHEGIGSCGYAYRPDDPVWARFGVPSPGEPPEMPAASCVDTVTHSESLVTDVRVDHGACGAYWQDFNAYAASLQQAYVSLDQAIADFNDDLQGRSFHDWYETTLTGQRIEETIVTDSRPGRVLAGGDMHLSGGRNVDAVVVAAGTIDGTALDNIASQGTRHTTYEGTRVFDRRDHSGRGLRDSFSRERSAPQPLADAPVTKTFSLPVLQNQQGGQPALHAAAGNRAPAAPAAARPTVGAVAQNTPATPATQHPPEATPGAEPPPVEATLRGSVIAPDVRAGQLGAVTAPQALLRVLPAYVPPGSAQAQASASQRGAPPPIKAAGYATVASQGAVRAPANQLFAIGRDPRAPLVQTDAAFTAGRYYTSSQEFLDQLGLDGEYALRRYGDGFAEQRLMDDQVLALTGRRLLSGYQDSEAQYQALLDAGVLVARQYQLSPGVALSAEQMALLTTDIVWLEMRTVALRDGGTTQALVPTLYLRRPVEGDLRPEGALIAGSNVDLRTAGDLVNSGTIVAHRQDADATGRSSGGQLVLQARNIATSGTLAGHRVDVAADNQLDSGGGHILGLGANSSVSLNARDIVLRTTTQTSHARIDGPHGTSTGTTTNADRIATVMADRISMQALGNIDLLGARIQAANDLDVDAQGDINVLAVGIGSQRDTPVGGQAFGRTGHMREQTTAHLGSQLSAGGNATLRAGGDLRAIGSDLHADEHLTLAGRNVDIRAAIDSHAVDQQSAVHGRGYE